MELSALAGIGGIEVLRDSSFESIGCPHHKKTAQLSYLATRDLLSQTLSNTSISCLITTKDLASEVPGDSQAGLAISENPFVSMVRIHNHLAKNTGFYGFRRDASTTGKNTRIHPSAVVPKTGVSIGKNCTIGSNVTIYEGTEIGDNVTIGPGTIIGSEGVGYLPAEEGPVPIIRSGGVRIHENVDIHSNCSIARPIFGGWTEIGSSVKIDNIVHIGQGTTVGIRTMIVALAVVGDDVTIGSDVWIGPGAVLSDHLVIGNKAYVTLGSVVVEDVPAGKQVTGNFAIEHKRFLAFLKTIR